jgi:hypothetical protein
MAAPNPNTILLAGAPYTPQERNASESILPGHLLEIVPSGGNAGLFRRHATAGGAASPWFARESLTPDRGATTLPIETPYATGETMRWIDGRDCLVLALVPANAAAIVAGDQLTSNGDGTLRKATGTDVVVARAAEAVNNSAGSAVARIRIFGGT